MNDADLSPRFAGEVRKHHANSRFSILDAASAFSLTAEETEELLPGGRQRRFDNRAAWAEVFLEQAGLLRSPKRGQRQITAEGLAT